MEILKFENRPVANGMGGNCFACAIALQTYCFPDEKIVLAVNSYLMNEHSILMGHCAVYNSQNGMYYDQEGEKEWERIESWGMIDPVEFDEYDLSEEELELHPYSVSRLVLSTQELLQLIGKDNMNNFDKIMNSYNSVAQKHTGGIND